MDIERGQRDISREILEMKQRKRDSQRRINVTIMSKYFEFLSKLINNQKLLKKCTNEWTNESTTDESCSISHKNIVFAIVPGCCVIGSHCFLDYSSSNSSNNSHLAPLTVDVYRNQRWTDATAQGGYSSPSFYADRSSGGSLASSRGRVYVSLLLWCLCERHLCIEIFLT